jgi:hypothetical protein
MYTLQAEGGRISAVNAQQQQQQQQQQQEQQQKPRHTTDVAAASPASLPAGHIRAAHQLPYYSLETETALTRPGKQKPAAAQLAVGLTYDLCTSCHNQPWNNNMAWQAKE